MTEPTGVPTDQQSSNNEQASSSGRFLVKTPWHVSRLLGNGEFPDIDNHNGVEMSGDEKDKAKAAAKQARVKLLVKEV